MQATKQRELYFLFRDENGEDFVVMDYDKKHAIETAKDWFDTRISFQHMVSEDYAERYGLDIY
jgi:hypothetical protein